MNRARLAGRVAGRLDMAGAALPRLPALAFVLGPQQWPTSLFLAVSTVDYDYKMLAAVATIPLIHLGRAAIIRFLGRRRADELRAAAAT